jgi:Alr-MurF fusion protein
LTYSISHIASIINAAAATGDAVIEFLLLDSRKVIAPPSSLFFALKGARRDGHQFIPELYKKGVRNFVVSEMPARSLYPGAHFLEVKDTLQALQQLASYHRRHFAAAHVEKEIPIIGITGSNGKTIVKEWLYQLLHEEFSIARSPKSYNSQIGVPLSIWQLNSQHTLGLFEAGISQIGEMENLEMMILPSVGILTNIGEAHNEGFRDKTEKLTEKVKLFRHCSVIIAREADIAGKEALFSKNAQLISWGPSANNTLVVDEILKRENSTLIRFRFQSSRREIVIPFTDDAAVENALTCFATAAHLGVDAEIITARLLNLQPVNMRLELKKGINQCTLINDSYSADIHSLEIALNFLDQQAGVSKKTVILSDVLESAEDQQNLYSHIISSLEKHKVSRLIGIGDRISEALRHLVSRGQAGNLAIELYLSTEAYTQQFLSVQFREETILVKGARIFGFERIVQLLEQKLHQTVLEINLSSVVHNLKEYQRLLEPQVRTMVMVKAFAYGSGGAEIAGILQYHKVDYLGVAYADEGVELRKAGILLPIMVLNPEENTFEAIVDNNLEPDIYSFELFRSFDQYIRQEGLQHYPVHVEIETGMNRLGFSAEGMETLAGLLRSSGALKVQTAFSHLVGSEDPEEDAFTLGQRHKFIAAAAELEKGLGYSIMKHISNSAAIVRHPQLQLDMVRLGIGLYGIDSANTHLLDLKPVTTLRSTIAQVKHLKSGESVSYNQKGTVKRDSVIATVRIGYADGYSRRLGNGRASMIVNGVTAPVIGTVCMDMTMLDITDIPGVKEGDDVIVFGKDLPIAQVAAWAETIPYEIMTGISQRVKRVYFEE